MIAVLFVLAVFFLVASFLLFQAQSERVVAANEEDFIVALGHVEAGLAWMERRVIDAPQLSLLLTGPDPSSTIDDHLPGLRDLSLTSTAQFTSSNEDTASAIVSRDFGDGSQTFEAFRVAGNGRVRGLVYVRVEDNFDDDPDDPTNNDPLTDTDGLVRVTVVSEYPVYVNASGVEVASNTGSRGKARRKLIATFGKDGDAMAAISSNGDIDIPGNMKLCGECGSIHANGDLSIGGGPSICKDATASGSYSGGGTIGGVSGGGHPPLPVPIINPYDDVFVPTIDVFDTSGDTWLPSGLRCPEPSPADPGSSKFFALVADDEKGRIYKAYWDFTNLRWNWRQIDNLDGGGNPKLDDCGRVEGVDPRFGLNDADAVNDGKEDEFYGFKGAELDWNGCGGSDASLSILANNDFSVGGHHNTSGGTSSSPRLPGGFAPNGSPDFVHGSRVEGKWDYGSDTIYSPLYGAVVWILGNVTIGGNPGDSSSVDFQCSGGAGCSSGSLPGGLWPVTVIAVGDIEMSGQSNLGPANPDAGYHFSLIAGRDLKLNGNPQEDTSACGSSCSTGVPSGIVGMAGIFAAHEQIAISGNPNIFGFMVAEDAIDCSGTVTGTAFNGDPQLFYDCNHPPNPWATPALTKRVWWEEDQD
ncbi:MAG: hypothetical protein GY716_15595 [bacterium]|nr:hypothetical protein [bacterium]